MPGRKAVVSTGDEYNDWTVLEYRPNKSLCQCECGRVSLVSNYHGLTEGGSKRCKSCSGKLRQTGKLAKRRVCLDLSNKEYMRLFWSVDNAIRRCSDPANNAWKDYGKRGIKVLQEWLDDKYKFVEYLSTLPGHDDSELVLDRIDNEGNYEPGNLRFVSDRVSSLNRRKGNLGRHLRNRRGRWIKVE